MHVPRSPGSYTREMPEARLHMPVRARESTYKVRPKQRAWGPLLKRQRAEVQGPMQIHMEAWTPHKPCGSSHWSPFWQATAYILGGPGNRFGFKHSTDEWERSSCPWVHDLYIWSPRGCWMFCLNVFPDQPQRWHIGEHAVRSKAVSQCHDVKWPLTWDSWHWAKPCF